MSIEQALAENTSAIHQLIAALSNGIAPTHAQVAAVVAEAPAKAEKVEAKKPTQTDKPASPPPVAETAAPAAVLDYEAIKRPFLALVNKKGRDAAAALLAHFGIDAGKGGKLSDIPADKYAEVLDAINEASA